MKLPLVTIIVLNYNQKEKTIRCLNSLTKISYPCFNIVLWDNGSGDSTAEYFKEHFTGITTFCSKENLGVAGGRNAAVELVQRTSHPEYLLFLDNDTTVEKNFLDKLVNQFETDYDIGICTPKIKFYNNPEIIFGAEGCDIKFWRGKTSHTGYGKKDIGQFDKNKDCISSGGCILIRSDVFNILKGFDERYNPYGPEDLDFVLRAKEKKYKCMYVFDSVIYHDPEPGRSSDRGKFTLEYAIRKLRFLKIFNKRHAPATEKFVFIYLSLPLLYFKILLKNIYLNLKR